MKDLTSNTKQEESFQLADGKIIKNILELKKSLKEINKETFNCHVNQEKNDFCNWIEGVYKDKILAQSIKKVKTPNEIINVIEKRLGDINKEKGKEVKEIIDAIEKVKNGPVKKPIKLPEEKMKPKDLEKEKPSQKETTREKIVKKLESKFKPKKKINLKKLNLIPICRLDREDMINQIKKGYENE